VIKVRDFALGAFLVALGLWGLAMTLPHTFSPGDEIKASEMNANFGALKAGVDSNAARLSQVGALEKALPSREGKVAYAYFGHESGAWRIISYYNSTGGAVTVQVNGPGDYDVTFEGFDLTEGMVQVTSGQLPPRLCVLNTRLHMETVTDTVNVRCFDLAGNLRVSHFVITAMK